MDYTNGTYKIIYIKVATVWIPIGCLTSNSFSESVSMLDTTTRDNSDGWTSSIPTSQQYNISFDGLLIVGDRGGTVITYDEIKVYKRARTQIEWKIESAQGGNIEEGFGYFTSISDSAGIDEFETFTAEIVGYNNPTTTIGNGYVLPDYVTSGYVD